ncbi:hypothetical protein U1Q18_010623 [Sarracenia purpurea var. burkii]
MLESPGNTLNVILFIPGLDSIDQTTNPSDDTNNPRGILTLQIVKEKEKKIDNEYIKEFRMMKASNKLFSYIEKVVNNGMETVEATTTCE